MRTKLDLKIPMLILIFAAVGMFFMYGGEYVGMPPDSANTFFMLLPGFGLIGAGVMLTPRGDVFTTAGFTIIGIGFSILIGTGYDLGIVSDQMLTGLTIEQEQMLIFVVFTAFGLLSLGRERWF